MWKKKERLVAIQNHPNHIYCSPSIYIMKLSDVLRDIGVSKIDEFRQEVHQIGTHKCRVTYNRGYYTAYIDDLISTLEFNRYNDIDLKYDDIEPEGVLRTFKTRAFVLHELHLIIMSVIVPSAPPAED